MEKNAKLCATTKPVSSCFGAYLCFSAFAISIKNACAFMVAGVINIYLHIIY